MALPVLQFGTLSNWVGSHFWDCNSALQPSQEGEFIRETIYDEHDHPRLLLTDFKQEFGGMPSTGYREAIDESVYLHTSHNDLQVETFVSEGFGLNTYLADQFSLDKETKEAINEIDEVEDNGFKYWSGFFTPDVRSNNLYSLNASFSTKELCIDADSLVTPEMTYDMEDRFASLLESCDSVSRVPYFVDMDTFWGGVSAKLLPIYKDYWGSSRFQLWSLNDSPFTNNSTIKAFNTAVSLYDLLDVSPFIVPIDVNGTKDTVFNDSLQSALAVHTGFSPLMAHRAFNLESLVPRSPQTAVRMVFQRNKVPSPLRGAQSRTFNMATFSRGVEEGLITRYFNTPVISTFEEHKTKGGILFTSDEKAGDYFKVFDKFDSAFSIAQKRGADLSRIDKADIIEQLHYRYDAYQPEDVLLDDDIDDELWDQ
ncbi:hypothetical protein PCE1_000236 [Barthelona sp. PCE]